MAKRPEIAGFPEPKWAALCKDKPEIAAAKAHWQRIVTEMRDRETLAEANGHSVQRLVLAYLNYDRGAAQVAKLGVVDEPSELGLRLWFVGIIIWAVGHALSVWAARRDPQFVDVARRHLRYPVWMRP